MNLYIEACAHIFIFKEILSEELYQTLDLINEILMKKEILLVKTLQLYFVKKLKSIVQINPNQYKDLLIKDLSEKIPWI
jgi:hypothetical protein